MIGGACLKETWESFIQNKWTCVVVFPVGILSGWMFGEQLLTYDFFKLVIGTAIGAGFGALIGTLKTKDAAIAAAEVAGKETRKAMRKQVEAQAAKENDRIRQRLFGELNRILLVLESAQKQLGFFHKDNNDIYENAREPRFSFDFGTEWRSLLYELEKEKSSFEQRIEIEKFINQIIYYVPDSLGKDYIPHPEENKENESMSRSDTTIHMVNLSRLFRQIEETYLSEKATKEGKSTFAPPSYVKDYVYLPKEIIKLKEFINQLKS